MFWLSATLADPKFEYKRVISQAVSMRRAIHEGASHAQGFVGLAGHNNTPHHRLNGPWF